MYVYKNISLKVLHVMAINRNGESIEIVRVDEHFRALSKSYNPEDVVSCP